MCLTTTTGSFRRTLVRTRTVTSPTTKPSWVQVRLSSSRCPTGIPWVRSRPGSIPARCGYSQTSSRRSSIRTWTIAIGTGIIWWTGPWLIGDVEINVVFLLPTFNIYNIYQAPFYLILLFIWNTDIHNSNSVWYIGYTKKNEIWEFIYSGYPASISGWSDI